MTTNTQDIAGVLKKHGDLRRELNTVAYCSGITAALAEGFIDCYDALPSQGPIDFADGWDAHLGEWWIGDRTYICPKISHWADIRWPEPPQKKGA